MSISREVLSGLGILPVLVIEYLEDAVPLAKALQAGGIKAVEVTLRTPVALAACEAIKAECDGLIVGVGTLTRKDQIDEVARLGLDFAISPGLTEELVNYAKEKGIAYLPGVATASEVMRGIELGLTSFKLFPAEAVGGIPLLKSLAGPFQGVVFCPTGGINAASCQKYLALSNVACIGGSWFVQADWLKNKDWAAITESAKETMALVNA